MGDDFRISTPYFPKASTPACFLPEWPIEPFVRLDYNVLTNARPPDQNQCAKSLAESL
jgi:hypothetical protein